MPYPKSADDAGRDQRAEVTPSPVFPEIETDVLKFWDEDGTFRAVRFRCGPDHDIEIGRRALAEWFGSFAPNTIIVGVDVERELILAQDAYLPRPVDGAAVRRLDVAGQDLHESRLSGAVRAGQAVAIAGSEFDGDVVEERSGAVRLRKFINDYHYR